MPKSKFASDEERREYDKKTSAAYSAAHTRLREAHRDEYNGYYAEECKARGIDWEPKLTPEKRAEQEMEALLKQYPHLAERLAERLAEERETVDA